MLAKSLADQDKGWASRKDSQTKMQNWIMRDRNWKSGEAGGITGVLDFKDTAPWQ